MEGDDDVSDRNHKRLIDHETSYEATVLAYRAETLNILNSDQRLVYDKVVEVVLPEGADAAVPYFIGQNIFFLTAPEVSGNPSPGDDSRKCRQSGRIPLAATQN